MTTLTIPKSRQCVKSRRVTLKKEYKTMALDHLKENIALKQELNTAQEELNHANIMLGDAFKRNKMHENAIKEWRSSFENLQEDYVAKVRQWEQEKKRVSPWALVAIAGALVVGLIVGMSL